MFRRTWAGLPQDLIFGDTLPELGYFINDIDEVRSLDNPDNYFRFHLSKNDRINERQRFHFNGALESIIIDRLHGEGLKTVRLPLEVKSPSQPHIPILVSENLAQRRRVVLFLGESTQSLGVLSHRIIGGRGGINEGSLVSLVKSLAKQQSAPNDSNPPGIIIANIGGNWWWPEGKRALSPAMAQAIPLASSVFNGREYDAELNAVPQLETWKRHLHYLMNTAVPSLIAHDTLIDVIAVGDAVDGFLEYLNDETTWALNKDRLNAGAFMGGAFFTDSINVGLSNFLAQMPDYKNPHLSELAIFGDNTATAENDDDWTIDHSSGPRHIEPSYPEPDLAEDDFQVIRNLVGDYRNWNREKLQETDQIIESSGQEKDKDGKQGLRK
ncbi:Autophagy-related protein 29 [Ceratocystis lukuohia]|uniref:Autophagy-related protein 29 n=1 Tax=Ceratocystis lukuohia TaxID=2019550 RepID=A0ABR4MCJ8_9PEZI